MFSAISFDAKDDNNVRMCETDDDGTVRHNIGTRSHYSIVEQPGGTPLGVFVPEKSTGQ